MTAPRHALLGLAVLASLCAATARAQTESSAPAAENPNVAAAQQYQANEKAYQDQVARQSDAYAARQDVYHDQTDAYRARRETYARQLRQYDRDREAYDAQYGVGAYARSHPRPAYPY